MKKQLYICSCNNSEHQMIFLPDPDENEKTIYIRVNLVRKPFWKRLTHGIKYICGYQSKYGAFDEIILDHEHSKQLRDASIYLDPKGYEQHLENTYRAWHGIPS